MPFSRGDGPPAIVRFTCPEFTSLCPVTGQPDFAHIVIDYAPDTLLVESKSLKLFMTSFRNHGAFHEDCTVMIGRRIVAATKPLWLRIAGYWYPRGGIPIDVFWQTGAPPEGCLAARHRRCSPIVGAAESGLRSLPSPIYSQLNWLSAQSPLIETMSAIFQAPPIILSFHSHAMWLV